MIKKTCLKIKQRCKAKLSWFWIKKISGKNNKRFFAFETYNPNLIEIINLSKSFGRRNHKHQVLKEINLTIRKGERLALIGANGAGKTTLVETIVGLNEFDQGSIKYNLNANNWNQAIGIQFQESSYPQSIRVWEVIYFMMNVYNAKLSKNELKEMIEVFGIKEFYTHNAKTLSGGQRQRLNLLLAILHKPPILFLDEISTGLDVDLRERIKYFIDNYIKENKASLILISHNYDEIKQLCDRYVILKNGQIVHEFSCATIKATYSTFEQHLHAWL